MFMIGERNEACVNLLADDANEGKNVVCENSETKHRAITESETVECIALLIVARNACM